MKMFEVVFLLSCVGKTSVFYQNDAISLLQCLLDYFAWKKSKYVYLTCFTTARDISLVDLIAHFLFPN